MSDRNDLDVIAGLVPAGSRVLDLGCGDGELLAHLVREKGCSGYGIEIDDAKLRAALARGIDVLQFNLDEGLAVFDDASFDVVLQLDTLQHLRNAEQMLLETARVGRLGIVSFPNFAHWPNRWSVARGRMPVTKTLPYQWYDTPNIRVGTYADFETLARRNGLAILDSFGLRDGAPVRWAPTGAPAWRCSSSRAPSARRRRQKARCCAPGGAAAGSGTDLRAHPGCSNRRHHGASRSTQ